MGESAKLRFDRRVRLEFHGATMTPDCPVASWMMRWD